MAQGFGAGGSEGDGLTQQHDNTNFRLGFIVYYTDSFVKKNNLGAVFKIGIVFSTCRASFPAQEGLFANSDTANSGNRRLH